VWPASQGAGVTVAVLSDGVVGSQPDLAGAVTAAPATAIPAAPVAGQFFGEQGTAVASLIAGRGHGPGGASGVIGVAPEARILSVPVTLPADDSELSQPAVAAAIPAAIAAGIKYAVSHGAGVIDLPVDPGQPDSAGGGAPAAAGGSAAELAAVNFALARNVVLVAPAGDDAETTDAVNYPAAYPGVIAVGAFNSAFDKAPWTSRRSYVTLTAAGAGVMAATNSGGYLPMNSTAAASAVVAGVVALIRSRYPALSVADIRKALITTTSFRRPVGLTDGSGYGALNAARAFSAAAALGTPATAQAGAGAQPRLTPSPAAAGTGAQSLTSQILRAGEISAAVLVLLMLVVIGYALTGRRRRPARLPATMAAQWTGGHSQSRYPHAPLTDADQMRELFDIPIVTQDRLGGRAEATGQSARAVSTGDLWRGEGDMFAAPPAPASEAARPTGSGPASRPVTTRSEVSGAPPWEPAPQPEGQPPPWTDEITPQTVAGEVVTSGYPPASRPPADSGPVARNGRSTWSEQPNRSSLPRHVAPEQSGSLPADAPPRWADPAYQVDRAGGLADTSASGQHRSGLPIRQPRTAARTPLSPSGSLWERAEPPTDDGPADGTDGAARPGFSWDQARSEPSR